MHIVCYTAQEIFRDVGKMLKERRESDDLLSIYSYSTSDIPDPAVADSQLAATLGQNAELAQENLAKVGNHTFYVYMLFLYILKEYNAHQL